MAAVTFFRAALGSLAVAVAAPVLGDAALDDARSRWQAAALAGYEYGYHKYCECHRDSPPETTVTVRDGQVVGVRHRPANTDAVVPAADKNLEYYWTVEGLFGLIASALERGVQVRALYDSERGFPREVFIDYDAEFIGDELDLRLTGVTALDGTN